MTGAVLRIRGRVQGVGFRPTVARLARARGLEGFVRNDGGGVLIGLAAGHDAEAFVAELLHALPPLARIEAVERDAGAVPAGRGFVIEGSSAGTPRTDVSPDTATCAACLEEVFAPTERRYRYPFTNCTHCGPRFSLVTAIPYDRANTTMADFALCDACRAEYADEADRRYHAQPVACHACGPRARLERSDGRAFSAERYSMLDEVDAAGGLLRSGEIVALKGLGGYQLCCDATNAEVVARLRERKRRPHRAFALMVRDLEVARRYAVLRPEEETLLESPEAPIVLAPACPDAAPPVAEAVAPGQHRLGIMLATTPLHALVMKRIDRPIVCTSGNRSDEPQCIDDADARCRLAPIADWILAHDRPIRNRVDDSVVAWMDGAPRVLRRARGYAPVSAALPPGFEDTPPILALGGDLKAAFALAAHGRVVVSQHLGDLDHPEAFAAYQDALDLLSRLYEHKPEAVACDRHPGYRSHEMASRLARARGLPTLPVVHHHAHIAACLAEHGRPRSAPRVLGLALDGLGLGEDDTLQGGELLWCSYDGCERVGTLKPVAMLGGDRASLEPWRSLYAHLRAEQSWAELDAHFGDTEVVAYLRSKPVELLEQMLERGLNAPLASSAGRLFDAVAAALGICREGISYEGQAAMQLEALVTKEALAEAQREPYPFPVPRLGGQGLPYVEPLSMWRALLGDLWAGVDPALVSARFHAGFATGLLRMVCQAAERRGARTVALSGGCFQNRILLELVADGLRRAGLEVLVHRRLPPNDGCLALGQAVLAAAALAPPGGSPAQERGSGR
ncbi:MAG: carbamoyltransferase HypF [Myxococcota bacterium]|nr:carbamoyltransferase HypF [Myxococcota bacterium]